jgi:hypothetical protein
MKEQIKTGGPGGLTIAGWRIYYGDGLVADSRQVTWEDCPADDVQVFSVYYQETYKIYEGDELNEYPYRILHHTQEYYWRYGAGNAEDAQMAGATDVKRGKLIPDEAWRVIYDRAHIDLTF